MTINSIPQKTEKTETFYLLHDFLDASELLTLPELDELIQVVKDWRDTAWIRNSSGYQFLNAVIALLMSED